MLIFMDDFSASGKTVSNVHEKLKELDFYNGFDFLVFIGSIKTTLMEIIKKEKIKGKIYCSK